MSFLGNLIWLIFGGLIAAILWFVIGLILCITVIGMPLGLQCFKMASLVLAPFGKEVKTEFGEHPIANFLWMILAGWELFLASAGIGLIFCITIIGIPFGKQWFKIAALSLMPFGADLN